MNKEKNTYIFTYSAIMVILVAIALTLANILLTPAQQANVAIEQQWQILKSVGVALDADQQKNKNKYIVDSYHKYIVDAYAVNSKGEKLDGVDAFKVDLKAEQKKPEAEREAPQSLSLKEIRGKRRRLFLFEVMVFGDLSGGMLLSNQISIR